MNVRKSIKLDLISIAPYLTVKNLILLVFFGCFYAVLFKNPIAVVGIAQIFALLFAAYPFMVGEEAGIDPLFKIMGIKSDEVVKGRYLSAFLFIAAMLIAGMILGLLISITIYPVDNLFTSYLLFVPFTFIVTSLIIFLQYPIYFKVGYLKGKTTASLSYMIFFVLLFWFAKLSVMKTQNLIALSAQFKFFALIGIIVLWCLSFWGSISLSKKYYRQRDF